MVVLEGSSMLSSASNQYIQPDYLSPLPIENLDAKKSPLALLAQTCSQIGADTPPSKSLICSEKSKKLCSNNIHSSSILGKDKCEKTCHQLTRTENKLVFKPYEDDIVSKKKEENGPSPKCTQHDSVEKRKDFIGTGRKSLSPTNYSATPNSESYKNSLDGKPITPTTSTNSMIRLGIEILHGNSQDLSSYKSETPSSGFSGTLNPIYGLPGVDHTNPAFRPSFPGVAFNNQQPGVFSSGYISSSLGSYVSYARVKTHSGGESLVPVCKNPYCTGCQFNIQNQQLLNGGTSGLCSSGCNQCDHQKYNLAMAMSLIPSSHLSPSALTYTQLGRPYVCNWITGDTYCGKRFVTSEELLQHLRTHTNGSDPNSEVTTSSSSLLNSHSLFSSTTLHRPGYPNSPLSPISARYHPYGKPTLPFSLAASPYSAFNPMAALGPYYSVYSVYGRIGAATVHP